MMGAENLRFRFHGVDNKLNKKPSKDSMFPDNDYIQEWRENNLIKSLTI